jgi:hypothetical protein
VDVADLAALAAADHCPADAVIENLGSVNHCVTLLVFSFADLPRSFLRWYLFL